MILVNFGCGSVHHSDWINFDSAPASPEVRRGDVRQRLPFDDASVDVVYHAHLLEHLDAPLARTFLAECHRILQSGGIMRVVVPDLEGIARAYLGALEMDESSDGIVLQGWTRMELTDQAARSRTGGAMMPFLRGLTPTQLALVRTRAGREVDTILKSIQPKSLWEKVTVRKIWRRLRRNFVRGVALATGGSEMLAAFDEGWFRQSGEVHRIMYDRLSLARLLTECGFVRPVTVTAHKSSVPDYAAYALDAVAGEIRKPDSLFMEAVRP